MTGVTFLFKENRLCGFEVTGHSSENEDDLEGKTVCAAVSSAAYLTANTIGEIIGDKYDAKVRDGFMRIVVLNPSSETETVLKGFYLHITELAKQYSRRIKIINGGVNDVKD